MTMLMRLMLKCFLLVCCLLFAVWDVATPKLKLAWVFLRFSRNNTNGRQDPALNNVQRLPPEHSCFSWPVARDLVQGHLLPQSTEARPMAVNLCNIINWLAAIKADHDTTGRPTPVFMVSNVGVGLGVPSFSSKETLRAIT
jgi:hypothetical protein